MTPADKDNFLKITGLTPRRLAQLLQDGTVANTDNGATAVRKYIEFLRTRQADRDVAMRLAKAQAIRIERRTRIELRQLITTDELRGFANVLVDHLWRAAQRAASIYFEDEKVIVGDAEAVQRAHRTHMTLRRTLHMWNDALEEVLGRAEAEMLRADDRLDRVLNELMPDGLKDEPAEAPAPRKRRKAA